MNSYPPGRRFPVPTLDEYVREVAALACPSGGRSLRRKSPVETKGLVTVVTVSFNSAESLPRTIDSVAAQSYRNIEYIIVDGGSSDGTNELLRQRESDIDLWISEPDLGIGDAFNKGIALAHGEFIALVNSDDWIEPRHVECTVERLRRSGADFVFGDLLVHDALGAVRYAITGDPAYGVRIRHAMPDVNHPSVVCRREVYERYGLYDRKLRIAMDYEWLLRGHFCGVRGEYAPGLTSHMRGAGVSDRNVRAGLAEVRDISIRYGYASVAAWCRFSGRICKIATREFIERWISRRLAARLRMLIHHRYRANVAGASARRLP